MDFWYASFRNYNREIKREFDLNLVITTPSITYEVVNKQGKREKVYSPYFFQTIAI